MSDRTTFTMTVHSSDANVVDAAEQTVAEATRPGWAETVDQRDGRTYLYGYEIPVGTIDAVVDDLAGVLAGVPFELYEDPVYELSGEAVRVTADGIRYVFSCFGDGEPVLSASRVTEILDGNDPAAAVAALRALIPPTLP